MTDDILKRLREARERIINSETIQPDETDYWSSLVIAAEAEIERLRTTQGCGHPAGCIVVSDLEPRDDAVTCWCRMCELEADNERLNDMLRKTGYGQGQIDAYAAECEGNERLRSHVALLRETLERVRWGWKNKRCGGCGEVCHCASCIDTIQAVADCPVERALEETGGG